MIIVRRAASPIFALAALAACSCAESPVPGAPPLGRAASGALAGAALFASEGRRTVTGGVLGVVGAVASAYVGELLRMQIGHRTGLPDLVVALLEDGVVIIGAHRLLR